MTNAKQLVGEALLLLEYRPDDVGDETALAVLNAVCRDVRYVTDGSEWTPLISLSQTLPLSAREGDAVLFGVAAQLSQSVDDTREQARYAAAYQRRRSSLPRTVCRRVDVLPGGEADGE